MRRIPAAIAALALSASLAFGQSHPAAGTLQIGQGASAVPAWLLLTGDCSITTPSSGAITCLTINGSPPRMALTGMRNYYVNGNQAFTNNTTAAGNNTLHFAAGSATTNATTAGGANVLRIAGTQPSIYIGATISDTTTSVIPASTTVTAVTTTKVGGVTTTNVTLSANVTGVGVGNGDTIQWSLSVFLVGQPIIDITNSGAIAANTTIASVTPTTVTLTANATGSGVGNGDDIRWSAPCGPTGAVTCSPGSDTANGLSIATPFLTTQTAVNATIYRTDLAGFTAAINLAHGASTNYAATCTNGPVVGQSVLLVEGDGNAPSAVGVVINGGTNGAFQIKDLCTMSVQNLACYDRPTNNGTACIAVGTGAPGHADGSGLSFMGLTIGTFVVSSYAGTFTFNGGGNAINGGANAAFSAADVATIDFSGIQNLFTVQPNLAWGTAFAVEQNGATFTGLLQLSGTGTFGNPSGHTGARFFASGPLNFGGFDPNSLFPGVDAVGSMVAGAIGVQSGSGASAAPNYGTAGQFFTTQGAGAKPTYDSLSAHLAAGTGISLSGTTVVTITNTAAPCTSTAGAVQYNNAGSLGCATAVTSNGTSLAFSGAAVAPTGNGQSSVGASATGGAVLIGQGSTNDLTLQNKNGTSVCVNPTGTTTLNCTGLQLGGANVLTGNQTVTLSGDVSGSGATSIATTVNKVNAVTYPSGPSANTVPVVTSAAGGGTVTYEAVPNAALANSAATVAGQTCTLGSSCGLSTASNTLGANVALNNTGNFFDGPSMAQGTSGTWFASGSVTVSVTAGSGAETFRCKLWDGTTVKASSQFYVTIGSGDMTISLSGIFVSPAANIRISCRDITSVNGLIIFNDSAASADSTISGIRIN